jgi:mono/diheme cytochrome c family protein
MNPTSVVMSLTCAAMLAATIFLQAAVAEPRQPDAARPGAVRSARDGIYTEKQAEKGEASYQNECAQCHLADLGGDGLRVTPLVGPPFLSAWRKRSVGDLFKVMKQTMPADRPMSLSDATYGEILAYILKVNGYPAGSADLSTNPADLAAVSFDK